MSVIGNPLIVGQSDGLPVRKPLNDTSWRDIDIIASAGKASEYWLVGDQKKVDIGGLEFSVEIVGFDHDDLSDGSGKAGITFGMVQLTNENYEANDGGLTNNVWMTTTIREVLRNTIMGQLPTDLQSVIQPVWKLTSAGEQSTTIERNEETLFLFSEEEVFGEKIYSVGGEGEQYPRFSTTAARTKTRQNGNIGNWWLRSPQETSVHAFVAVSYQGIAQYNVNSYGYLLAIAAGFCVGKPKEPQLPTKKSLNATSWEDIQTIANAGKASEYWSIGDQKTIYIDGAAYNIEIVGFDHDELADANGKAAITFGLQTLTAETYAMNSTATNAGGWEQSELRKTLQTSIFGQLESDLQVVVERVTKLTSAGQQSTEIVSTKDTLFLPAEAEIATKNWSNSGEGARYARYASTNDVIKYYQSTPEIWRSRSPDRSSNAQFVDFLANGTTSGRMPGNKTRIAFFFCVGRSL